MAEEKEAPWGGGQVHNPYLWLLLHSLSSSRGVFCLYCKDSGEPVGLASQAFSFARRKFEKSQDLRSPAEDLREDSVPPICEGEQSLGSSVWNSGPRLLCFASFS